MMLNGNRKSAMRYVVNQAKGGVLKLDEETIQQLYDKHPRGEAAAPETLIKGFFPVNLDPIVFAALDRGMIKKCALQTEGAAGVSQADDQIDVAQDGYQLQRNVNRFLCGSCCGSSPLFN